MKQNEKKKRIKIGIFLYSTYILYIHEGETRERYFSVLVGHTSTFDATKYSIIMHIIIYLYTTITIHIPTYITAIIYYYCIAPLNWSARGYVDLYEWRRKIDPTNIVSWIIIIIITYDKRGIGGIRRGTETISPRSELVLFPRGWLYRCRGDAARV